MDDKRRTEITPIPMEPTLEDNIERQMHNIYHVVFQIDRRLDDIANAIEANTVKIEILEEAISKLVDIPARELTIRYDHEVDKLWINERFYIKFDGKEADLFGKMFFMSSGKPKKIPLVFDDVIDDYADHATGKKPTRNSLFQTANRIEAKLNGKLHAKVLEVNTKMMRFSKYNR